MLNQERIHRLDRFCVVGGTVAVVDFSTVWLLSHFLQPLVSVSIAYFVGVTWAGNNKWDVQGPTWSAESINNPFSGRAMEAGAEITNNSAHAVGNIQDLYYLDTAGDLISGWSGASIQPPSSIISSISWVGSGHGQLAWSTGSCS